MSNLNNSTNFIFISESVCDQESIDNIYNINTKNKKNNISEKYYSDQSVSNSENEINSLNSDSYEEKKIKLNNDYSSNSNYSENDSYTEKDLENFENIIMTKLFKNNIISKIKYYEEINNINNVSKLDEMVLKNNYLELNNLLNKGLSIYKSHNEEIIKICCKQKCSEKCNNDCYKGPVFKAINNVNRGIKTTYHLLLKILIIFPKFRNFCKCCENLNYKEYLIQLDKNFNETENKNKKFLNISTNIDSFKILELQINFLINKFLTVVGLFSCECKFKNKYYKFYKENYLNFKEVINIFNKTIPFLIKLLKQYFNLKDNNEELYLIKNNRCIHEDIIFNNLTYCLNKKYDNFNSKIINEIIMNLDILNDWLTNSIKISLLLLNQQSLEYFRNILKNFKISEKKLISEYFDIIYPIKNDLLDINYSCNKKNIINSVLEYKNNLSKNNLLQFLKNFVFQLTNRNINNKYDINNLLLNYILECFKNNNINFGLEFLKFIKNITFKSDYYEKIEYIFNTLLSNEDISIDIKISYLKIINKNKINVIQYDIVDKLIYINSGDKIILEFKKEENSLFNIDDYKNNTYISDIIKKCIINNKENILDYVLFNLENSIKNFKINPIMIYLLNIPKNYLVEYKYINLLKIILKNDYFKKYLEFYNLDTNENNSNQTINNIYYCIINEFTLSAKILILATSELSVIINKKNLLFHCIDYKNHIIGEALIIKFPKLIYHFYNNLNIFNYLFNIIKNDKNILIRFLIKIIEPFLNNEIKNTLINFQDENNELLGFLLLNGILEKEDKILIFTLLKNYINPIEINNYCKSLVNKFNFPIILYSVLINEYEITFIMLNYLLRNKMISKDTTTEDNGNTIFDYYIKETKININFMPIIFKYIKENHINFKEFEEKHLITTKFCFLIDQIVITNLLFIMKCIIYFFININFKDSEYKEKVKFNNEISLTYDNSIIKKNISKKINYELIETENKFEEINESTNIWLIKNSKLLNLTEDTINYSSSEIEQCEVHFNAF